LFCFVIFQFVCFYLYCVVWIIFNVLITCSIVAFSHCRFVIVWCAGSFILCIVLLSVTAFRRTSHLLAIVN
jgi:hypothetical protein